MQSADTAISDSSRLRSTHLTLELPSAAMGSTEPLVAAAVASVEGSADEVSVLEPVLDVLPEPVDEEEPVVPEEAVLPPAVEEEVVLWLLAPSLELELEEPEP